jgi:hypothetical protein
MAYVTLLNVLGPVLFYSEQFIYACYRYKYFERKVILRPGTNADILN